MVSNSVMKNRISADRGDEEAEERVAEDSAAKKHMRNTLAEVKRIADVEKLREKIVAKRRATTEKAKAKSNSGIIDTLKKRISADQGGEEAEGASKSPSSALKERGK